MFRTYQYSPQELEDNASAEFVDLADVSEGWLDNKLKNLGGHSELAVCSEIHSKRDKWHLPMIDLSGNATDMASLHMLLKYEEVWRQNFYIYSTGRSYHIYGDRLISGDEWVQFMGSLLLLNIPGGARLIDSRWIGHRLLSGYAALRWSCNTSQYKWYPRFKGLLSEVYRHASSL